MKYTNTQIYINLVHSFISTITITPDTYDVALVFIVVVFFLYILKKISVISWLNTSAQSINMSRIDNNFQRNKNELLRRLNLQYADNIRMRHISRNYMGTNYPVECKISDRMDLQHLLNFIISQSAGQGDCYVGIRAKVRSHSRNDRICLPQDLIPIVSAYR